MAIEFSESAGKHGFTRDDAIHAVNNHTGYQPEFDNSRVGGPSPHLAVGPAINGEVIEVMFTVNPQGTIRVFHCMHARTKIKDILQSRPQRQKGH